MIPFVLPPTSIQIPISSDTMAQLAPLKHLTDLKFGEFRIDLAGKAPAQPLPSVQVLRLTCLRYRATPIDATFCSNLAKVVPNLRELHINFGQTNIQWHLTRDVFPSLHTIYIRDYNWLKFTL